MLDAEVLVRELLAVDGFPASAVALGEISALDHESRDDTVEAGACIAEAVLAGGELVEVSGCLWDLVSVETHDNAAEGLLVLFDVEIDLLGDGGVSHFDDWYEVDLEVGLGEEMMEVKID
jgi:hypothetical protein